MQYSTVTTRQTITLLFTGLILVISALLLSGCKCNVKTGKHCSELTVTMQGDGSGRVTSVPEGINCEPSCTQGYVKGTPVTLTASAYSGSEFATWSGGCSGSDSCMVSINENTQVAAVFDLLSTDISNLITPYVNASDMTDIRQGVNSIETDMWSIHDGLDIYPNGDLKPFHAVCDGRVHWIYVGDEQVIVTLACNSVFSAGYNFETQEPNTGHIQLANIQVTEGQQVSQGELIGHLYAPNVKAHVHFTLEKNWVFSCPTPYFSLEANNSMLDLLHEIIDDAELCFGPEASPLPMLTPYVSEADIAEISTGFSTQYSHSPWSYMHDGLDIYPKGDLTPFQAACAGTVDSVQLVQAGPGASWQVKVLIQCDDYVEDPAEGGYFTPFSTEYVFEPMSKAPPHGQQQLANISVTEGQLVSSGDIIGYLYAAHKDAHLQFNLVQYGSSFFSSLGVPRLPICPEPHFSTFARDSVLNLLRNVWPSANMCH